ncbi:hypothetical protein M9H77_28201 [Catharanthus roseus]|uniref:Uncharacterized protein n=1 Tax=Catharanthus roseus TaxID=4058 RepID=A0ACC0AIX9_CATRO|nr:hypothetical protein M9H77_28201 [Catharanthus roseus]
MAYFGFTRNFGNNHRRCDVHALISKGWNTSQFGPHIYLIYLVRVVARCSTRIHVGRTSYQVIQLGLQYGCRNLGHHAILSGKKIGAVYALVATVSLALVFTGFQGMEYYQAPSMISDSIYGSTFFLAIGFHVFQVIIGTLFLIICGIRQYLVSSIFLPNLSLLWHINEGIEKTMADHVHQEMTRNWILVYLRLFLLIVIKYVFLSLVSFLNKSKNLMDRISSI